jgi:hypothetical protein
MDPLAKITYIHAPSILLLLPLSYIKIFPSIPFFPRGREADHAPPSSTEAKNGEAIPPLN